VEDVKPYRRDGGYLFHLKTHRVKVNVLGADWDVQLADVTNGLGRSGAVLQNFSFEAMSTADAEKLADAKEVVVTGHVREVVVPRFTDLGPIRVVLEDVQVDGKTWKAYLGPVVGLGKGGGGAFGGAGGVGKGKGGGIVDPKDKTKKKTAPIPP
jgi:hypothetical protein